MGANYIHKYIQTVIRSSPADGKHAIMIPD